MAVRNSFFTKIIAVLIAVQFIATGVPAKAFALKTLSARSKTDVVMDITGSMDKAQKDGGTRVVNEPWVGVNTFVARLGKATGLVDIANIIRAGAQVIYINHSEERALLERMKFMVESVYLAIEKGDKQADKKWIGALDLEGLTKDDIAVTLPWLETLKDQYAKGYDEADFKVLVADLTRDLSNQVQHVKFRELLKIAEEFEKKYGFNPIKQIVLCVGETQAERDRVMKDPKNPDAADLAAGQAEAKRIVERDFTKTILGYKEGDSIDLNLLKKYDFRVANEARTLIGKTGEIKDWQLDQALDVNQYIMEVLAVKVLGRQIPVDYGAGTDADLVRKIGKSKYVSGWLIGTAGKAAKSLGEIIDACNVISNAPETKGKAFNIGVNLKAESWKTGADLPDTMGELLLTKDFTYSRLVIGVNPSVFGEMLTKTKEISHAMVKASPEAEILVGELAKNLGNEAGRAAALAKIEAVSEGVKDFADLFLIKGTGQVDSEQLAALKSRIRKEKNPEIAAKRVAVFGSTSVPRLSVRELTGDNYDNLELVAVVGKPNEEIFPFLKRDSQQGVFPGRAEAPNNDFMYLGKQDEAVRVFSDKDFISVVENLPWKALALDAIILDEDTFKKLGPGQLAKLEGIQIVVSRAAGAGYITYVPGLSNEAEIQKEMKISAAAGDTTAVVSAVNVIKELAGGDVVFVNTDVTEAWNEQVPSTYKLESAYQTGRFQEPRFNDALSSQLGISPEKIADTWVIKTQISHGQLVIVTVGVNKELKKEEVLAKFNKFAGENDVMGLPEKWVKLTSNVIWGEKRVFFSPDDLYVKSYPGGTMVTALLFVDEDMANVDAILRTISQKSSAKTPAAKAAKQEYATSAIMKKLQEDKAAKDKASAAKKAQEAAARVSAVKNARKQLIAGKNSLAAAKLLFGEDVSAVSLLPDANGKIVGAIAVKDKAILATSLVVPQSIEDTQAAMAAYYIPLRDMALSLSEKTGEEVEVLDVYRPEEKLRVRFGVNARDPKNTAYKTVEQNLKGVWTVIAEPNTVINPNEFAGKFVLAVNGAGGRIGSLATRFISDKDRKNIRIIAMGGPESDKMADFIKGRDYVQGAYEGDVQTGKDWIEINGKRSIVFSSRVSQAFREPENYPWGTFIFAGVPVDLAVDATGNFATKKKLNLHRQAGAGQAWVTAPGEEEEISKGVKTKDFKENTFVMNRNTGDYSPAKNKVGSTASCTTGCLSNENMLVELTKLSKNKELPGLEEFAALSLNQKRAAINEGVSKFKFSGFMVTYHALTEEIIGPDRPSAPKKQTRNRGASEDVLPTTTGAASAILSVDAAADMDGLAVRFPTDVGSLSVATYILEGTYTKDDVLLGIKYLMEVVRGVAIKDVDTTGKIKLDKELRQMMATISPDKIVVKNFVNSEGKAMSMVKIDGWYENELYYAREIADFYDFVMRPLSATSIVAVKSDGRLSTGAEKSMDVPLVTEMAKSALKGAKVLLRVDFNVSDKNGNIKFDNRVRKSLNTIRYLIDNGATVVLISHNGKPAGELIPELSMQKPAEKLQDLLGEAYKVNFIAESINKDGVAAGVKEKIVEGAINVVENTRFCPGDEKNSAKFSEQLAGLVDNDMYVFDGFGAGERVHASTAGAAAFVNRIAIGQLVDQEESSMASVLENMYLIGLGGGPKLADKVPAVKGGAKNLKPGGGAFIGSAPSVTFHKAKNKIVFGQKTTQEAEDNAKAIIKTIEEEKKGTVYLPVDYVATTVNLDEKIPGSKKTWLEKGQLPEGARIYNVRLDIDNKKFIDKDTNAVMNTEDLYVYDIGPETTAIYAAAISNAPEGSAVIWNGAMGVNEIEQFESGTKGVARALSKVSITPNNPEGKIYSKIIGDDTAKAVDEFEMTDISTGGGASLGLMGGKILKARQALQQIQGNIVTATKVGLKAVELARLRADDETFFFKRGGAAFVELIKGVRGFLRSPDTKLANRGIIIGPEFFRVYGQAGSIKAVKEVAALSKLGVKFAIYGSEDQADNLRVLIGDNDIIVGTSKEEVRAQLKEIGIDGSQISEAIINAEGPVKALAQTIKGAINVPEVDKLVADFTNSMVPVMTAEVTSGVEGQEKYVEIMGKV